MKVVIDIPEEDYNNIEPFLNGETIKGGFNLFKVLEIIKKGKPLPKGHGDLKDVNDIWNNIPDVNVLTNYFTTYDIQHFIDHAPTIIEGSDS